MKPLDLIILLLTIFLSACQDKQKEIITLLVKEWQGKQILFPENMVFTRFASDTTNFVIPTSDYKVLVFVDSIGCTSCKLQLSRWKEFIRYTDSISQKNIPFLFFFQFDDQWEIHSLLIRENFDKPICLDRSDSHGRRTGYGQLYLHLAWTEGALREPPSSAYQRRSHHRSSAVCLYHQDHIRPAFLENADSTFTSFSRISFRVTTVPHIP